MTEAFIQIPIYGYGFQRETHALLTISRHTSGGVNGSMLFQNNALAGQLVSAHDNSPLSQEARTMSDFNNDDYDEEVEAENAENQQRESDKKSNNSCCFAFLLLNLEAAGTILASVGIVQLTVENICFQNPVIKSNRCNTNGM